jgi:hypothetical protein
MMQIKKKLSFATLTAYLVDVAMEQLKARSPSIISRLMRWLLQRFVKNK